MVRRSWKPSQLRPWDADRERFAVAVQGGLFGAYAGRQYDTLQDLVDAWGAHGWHWASRDAKILVVLGHKKIPWGDRSLPVKIGVFLAKTSHDDAFEEGEGGNLLTTRVANLARRQLEDAENKLRVAVARTH